jgi:predicted transposase YdaD
MLLIIEKVRRIEDVEGGNGLAQNAGRAKGHLDPAQSGLLELGLVIAELAGREPLDVKDPPDFWAMSSASLSDVACQGVPEGKK